MSGLDDRKKAHESKFAHDEKLSFEVEARGSKLFGLWVAEHLGLDDDSALTYAKEVVCANLDEPGFDDILRKVKPDLEAKGVELSDNVLNGEIEKAMIEARKQLSEG
jgi:hypothetical protein